MKKIVILYHAGCRDGFGAAWTARKKFGRKAAYIPVEHGAPPPRGLISKEIYTLDFTYPRAATEKLMKDNVRVTSIDHHVSAEKITKMTEKYSYAARNSGAVLSWKYFHKGEKTPFLLRCVEDADIWKWKVAKSREILAYLDLFPTEFASWNKIAKYLESPAGRREYARNGKIILRYYDSIVRGFAGKAELVRFLGRVVYAVNVPGEFRSDVGHILAKKHPPFSVLWRAENGKLKVSLRSDGSVDVSRIAAKFGGGGHKAAASFSVPLRNVFPWRRLKRKNLRHKNVL